MCVYRNDRSVSNGLGLLTAIELDDIGLVQVKRKAVEEIVEISRDPNVGVGRGDAVEDSITPRRIVALGRS